MDSTTNPTIVTNPGPKEIKHASEIIKKGGLIVYPTETLYGLGCDPFNKEAVNRVFHVKKRKDKPLPIIISSLTKAREIAHFTPTALQLAKRFWPGPLTLVLKLKHKKLNHLGGNHQSIGLRIPMHPVASRIAKLSGGCIIGTSANITGGKPPKTAQEAFRQIGKQVDMLLDCGETKFGMASTVIAFTEKPKLLRAGPISKSELNFIELDS